MSATISNIDNPAPFTTAATFTLWTQTSYGVMRDVCWNFASLGFGPAVANFATAKAQFFTPQKTSDYTELDTNARKKEILTKTDLEIMLQFTQPVRMHDTITIKIPTAFSLVGLGS